jgi:cation:H+ antiporter
MCDVYGVSIWFWSMVMLLNVVAVLIGLVVLVWSADRFVDSAAVLAKYLGMPALLIGILVIGFGTSAPEMVVSVLAATSGAPALALGNAYGSNITNIALILGLTALLSPIVVQSQVVRRELHVLLAVSGLALWQVWDGQLTRIEGVVLLLVLAGLMVASIWSAYRQPSHNDAYVEGVSDVLDDQPSISRGRAVVGVLVGLIILVLSSRLLVWGAVGLAQSFGVSELIIGLTIVAIGTSLPELVSSIMAVRKGEHDMALGNIIGSNIFNTLAVVGLAASIHPMQVASELLSRDMVAMLGLTVLVFLMSFSLKRGQQGQISRLEGGLLLSGFVAYTGYLIATAS